MGEKARKLGCPEEMNNTGSKNNWHLQEVGYVCVCACVWAEEDQMRRNLNKITATKAAAQVSHITTNAKVCINFKQGLTTPHATD